VKTKVELPTYPVATPNAGGAAARAAEKLKTQFGQRAAGSLAAMQQAVPDKKPTKEQLAAAAYSQQVQQGMAAQQQQLQHRQQQAAANNGAPQYDGPSEEIPVATLVKRAKNGDVKGLGRVELDRMLYTQLMANARRMEGGGVMAPLREATKAESAAARAAVRAARRERKVDKKPAVEAGVAIPQVDGDEDDDNDEDAINSALDDSDDGADGDSDDEETGNVMLCLYDKVQRVKNKW
jgi:transcription initiation factor TFIIA large subunit